MTYDTRCGGLGYYNCYCGGDFCICDDYGEIECRGCPDCDDNEYYDWGEDSDDE